MASIGKKILAICGGRGIGRSALTEAMRKEHERTDEYKELKERLEELNSLTTCNFGTTAEELSKALYNLTGACATTQSASDVFEINTNDYNLEEAKKRLKKLRQRIKRCDSYLEQKQLKEEEQDLVKRIKFLKSMEK